MGIVNKIFIIILLFLTVSVNAQNYDTIFFSGQKFVKHYVKAGESLKKIATLHNIKTSDIKDVNELGRRLYYNQLLYIPVFLNSPYTAKSANNLSLDKSFKAKSLNVALLLPYYLLKNDTMFNDYDDTLQIPNIYFKRSELALSFHIGVDLAINYLREQGKEITLHTFDTNQDSIEVKKIISSKKLDNMDIIIGPIYSRNFQLIAQKYGNDTSKIIISPLSRNNKYILNFPSIYQIMPTYKVQAEILINYLVQNRMQEKILILYDKKSQGLSRYSEYMFKQMNKSVNSFLVNNTHVDSIRRVFSDRQNLLLLSTDRVFLSKILASIGSIDSSITVFGFESIKSFDNLDITNLMELDVHIPNTTAVNYNDQIDCNFKKLFEDRFNTNFKKYSKIGFDIILHFCDNKSIYDFRKLNNGYSENYDAPIYHYFDYDLISID